MQTQRTRGERAYDAINILCMWLLVAIMLYPIVYVFCVSFSEAAEVDKGGLFLTPRGFSTSAYELVFKEPNIWRSYLNTVLYTVGDTFVTLLLTSMIAYTLTVPDFVLKKPLTVFLTITMFIGGGMIPSYLLMKSLGLLNTYWVMVLPGCVGAYNVVLFRTFFKGNAISLREAARIDGAGEFRIYAFIVVPLSGAIFATMGLFAAVGAWNSWFSALIYLKDESRFPYQLLLRRILDSIATTLQQATQGDAVMQEMVKNNKYNARNIQMAAIVVGMVPILCVYPFIQKYFVKGVFVGSLKE